MLIRIEHTTTYDYASPIFATTQYLRLTPSSDATQSVDNWKLVCPDAETFEWQDAFGNICHTLRTVKPVARLAVTVKGLVRTYETNGVTGWDSEHKLTDALFLRETHFTGQTPVVRRFAGGYRDPVRRDALDGLHALMRGIREAVAYERGATDVRTTATDAIEAGRGVCQDHAHVFCAAARSLGVPARYVSGYLAEERDEETRAETHAWAEALVPHLGWVSFDPSNGVSADENYVRVATGLDYADAGPVRGVRTGGGEETMEVLVRLNAGAAQQ
jgi:transglutaminase-like putative cysteine protease